MSSDAIIKAGLDCHALPDGAAVRVSDRKWYGPDALVYCGPEAPADDLDIKNPLIVVEVVSPSTVQIDEARKLAGYLAVPSIAHYLLVYPEGLPLIDHCMQADGSFRTTVVSEGILRLDPPGIEIDVAAFFG